MIPQVSKELCPCKYYNLFRITNLKSEKFYGMSHTTHSSCCGLFLSHKFVDSYLTLSNPQNCKTKMIKTFPQKSHFY